MVLTSLLTVVICPGRCRWRIWGPRYCYQQPHSGSSGVSVFFLAICIVDIWLCRAPDFDSPSERFGYPFGLIIFYGWNFVATIILVNVLIALFGSAYSDVTDNETDEYLVFFAHKTIDLIRAPDSYVYSAPFNLIEAFLIAPFE